LTSTTELTLSDEARAYLEARRPELPFWDRDIDELRREMREECLSGGGEPEPVASIEGVNAGDVPARQYWPKGAERDVFVWMHGGGWMLGDIDCSDRLSRAIANRAHCAVLSIAYRLAPEHTFPAAIDDAWTATAWASERFERVAVGGDSAGGNLAAAVALRCRDRGVALAHQLLVYPALQPDVDSDFFRAFRTRYRHFLGERDFGADSQEGIRRVWEVYIPDPLQRTHPDAAPMCAASVAGVAPATIITAEHDVLRGEGEAYAHRLRDEHVAVELINYDGQLHGFFYLLGVMEAAHDAVERASLALRRAFTVVDPSGGSAVGRAS
jgi:acetyl esterase